MKNLCITLRSIFSDPISSHPFFIRCPSSDSLALPPPLPAFQPLCRSLSLDRSSLHPPSSGEPLHDGDVGPAAPQPQAFSTEFLSSEKRREPQLQPAPRFDDRERSNDRLDKSLSSADCPLASLEADKSSDDDDGSVAWRLFGKGWDCISAGNNTSNEKVVERPVPKSPGTRRKIKLYHCTEELGSESSGAQEDVSSFDSLCESQSAITIPEAKWKAADSLMQHRETVQPVLAMEHDSQFDNKKLRSLGHKRKFPPPLTSYASTSDLPSDSFSFSLRPYRKNGRFVLEEVKVPVPCREYLRASREDGRLRLEFVSRTYNEDFAKPQIPRDDFLEEEAELDITSQGEEWEVTQAVMDTDFSMENVEEDSEEMKEESASQITTIPPMIPIPKKSKSCIVEASSSLSSRLSSVGEKQLLGVAFENDREVMDSPIHSASFKRSKRKLVERVNMLKNVEPHQAKSLPCVGYKLSAPLMNRDSLSSSNCSVLQCSLNQQTLACHDIGNLPLLSEKPCRNVNSSEKKLLLACSLMGGVLPATGKMNKTIAGRLDDEELVGKSKTSVSFEGARSLPSDSEWDLQLSFAGICAALTRHGRFCTLPCKKELETSELDKCMKLHLVATNS